MSQIKAKLLNKTQISRVLLRLSHEIIEDNVDIESLAIIGIRTRGEVIAKRIVRNIENLHNKKVQFGVIDVTFYRDDFSKNLGSPMIGPSEISFDITDKKIILIDDVLYTGRTIRAALNELFSFGRPSEVKLGVLVDRGHREVPIKADFVGKNFPTSIDEHVHVLVSEVDKKDEVNLVKY